MLMKMKEKVREEKKRQIYKIIKREKKVLLKELRHSTKINYNTIRSSVIRLTEAGFIKRVGRGLYEAK